MKVTRKVKEVYVESETFVLELDKDELKMLMALIGNHISSTSEMPNLFDQVIDSLAAVDEKRGYWQDEIGGHEYKVISARTGAEADCYKVVKRT